jgi:hypothetical protein
MAKAIENAATLLKELQAMESRAQTAIDELMQKKRELRAEVEIRTSEIDKQIEKLDEVYKAASGRYYVGTVAHRSKGDGAKRPRRSKEDMAAEAKAVYIFVKATGKDGTTGPEIREKFPQIGQSIVKFMEDNGGGKLTKTGASKSTKYYVE